MSDRIVGIDISSRVVRAAEVRLRPKRPPKVLRVSSVEIVEGVIRRGEIIEPKTLAAALRQLWVRGRFRTRRAAIGMAGTKIYVRDAILPKTPIAYLREQLPFIVQDLIPLPVEEALLDFYPAATEVTDEGPMLRGILVASRTEVSKGASYTLLKAGLSPVSIDFTGFGVVRAIEPIGKATGRALTIAVGTGVTNLIVTEAGVPRFARTVSMGDLDMLNAISRRLQISYSEAQALRNRIGITTQRGEDRTDLAAVEAIHSASWDLLSSIRDTVTYYASVYPELPIERINLVGVGVDFPGFHEALGDLVGLPVTLSTIDGVVQMSRSFARTPDRDAYITAVGIAMGGRR